MHFSFSFEMLELVQGGHVAAIFDDDFIRLLGEKRACAECNESYQ